MLENRGVVAGIHIREGVGATVTAEQERVARRVVAGVVGLRPRHDKSAV